MVGKPLTPKACAAVKSGSSTTFANRYRCAKPAAVAGSLADVDGDHVDVGVFAGITLDERQTTAGTARTRTPRSRGTTTRPRCAPSANRPPPRAAKRDRRRRDGRFAASRGWMKKWNSAKSTIRTAEASSPRASQRRANNMPMKFRSAGNGYPSGRIYRRCMATVRVPAISIDARSLPGDKSQRENL